MSNRNPRTDHLPKLGTGDLTPEQEHEIRSQGGKQLASNKRRAKSQAEALNALLDAKITSNQLLKRAESWGISERDALSVLGACIMLNECRKGTIDSYLRILDAAGISDSSTDEAAHAAFLQALTADDDEQSSETAESGDEIGENDAGTAAD